MASSSIQVAPVDDRQTQVFIPPATPVESAGETRHMDPQLYKAAAGMKTNGGVSDLHKRHMDFGHQRTPTGNTVLHIAAQFGEEERVRVILRLTPASSSSSSLLGSKNQYGDTSLHLAAREGHVKVVDALIQAAPSQDVASVFEFLKMGNGEGDTALHEAVRHHHPEVVKLLIDTDPRLAQLANSKSSTPLYMAAERGFSDSVSIILDNSSTAAHQGPGGRTALHAAVISKHPEMVKKLLQWKPQLNQIVDDQGWSPLHCAAYLGYTSIAKLLIDELESCHGADKPKSGVIYLGIKEDNKTALHIAACRGHKGIARLLASHYPDCCEQVDDNGDSAIHLFMSQRRHFLTLFSVPLFRTRGLLNGKNKKGNTPLHSLADFQMDHGTDFILSERVDKMALNVDELTAIDIISSADQHSLGRQHSILKKLKSVKARAGPLGWQKSFKAITNSSSSSQKKEYCRDGDGDLISAMKSKGENHLVVVTLIATITFAAGFTLPGGYNNDDGMAILTKKTAFQIFVVADTAALVLSMSAICVYFFMALKNRKEVLHEFLNWGFNLSMYAMGAMMIAFVMGLYTVLPHSTWLVVFVCAFCGCFFIFLFYILRKFYSSWKMMIKSSFWFRKFKLFVIRRRQLTLMRRGKRSFLKC